MPDRSAARPAGPRIKLDAAPFPATCLPMDVEPKDGRWVRGVAWPLSVLAHLVVALLVAFPISLPEPEMEQAVDLELVPPPKQPDRAKTEPEKPPPKTPGKADAKPQPKAAAPVPNARMPAFEPVFRYGEKDAGPRKSPAGNSAEDDAVQPETSPTPAKVQDGKGAGDRATPPPTLGATSQQQDRQKPPPVAASAKEPKVQPEPSKAPPLRPGKDSKTQAAKNRDAKKQFSQQATNDPITMTAMGGVPREVRGGRLCVAELRERMLRASPPYYPDLLPSYALDSGVILQVTKGAIRIGGQWSRLSFRCEVDTDATRVVGFDFRVGDRLERGEAERRRLPLQ